MPPFFNGFISELYSALATLWFFFFSSNYAVSVYFLVAGFYNNLLFVAKSILGFFFGSSDPINLGFELM